MGRILFVDDEPNIRELLQVVLTHDGHAVTTAADGDAAVAQATDAVPDLVVLDLILPGHHGLDVAGRLNQNPRTAHIPVIVLTSVGKDQIMEAALDSGADDFLVKPVDATDLRIRVAALLTASQAGDGLTRALKYLEMLEGDRGSNREDGRRVPCDAV